MGIYDETVEVSRRMMVLFFLIDTSSSMIGSKIGTVNQALEEVIPEIKKISRENADAEIKIAALTFSSGAEWLSPAPEEAESFYWNYVDANGMTDLGEALSMLNEKLSRNAFMQSVSGSFAPAIFLMSDGAPTDDYKRSLNELKQNRWFQKAIKVAVAIGDDADQGVLAEFTGNTEAVITAHTPEALTKMIRFVSVTASQIGSKSSGVGGGNIDSIQSKQDDMIQQIQQNSASFASEGENAQW